MKKNACTWTRTGEANVDLPIEYWNANAATIVTAITMALRRKNLSSPMGGATGC
jgi:hypothetical protein